jgi:hypothetical protein
VVERERNIMISGAYDLEEVFSGSITVECVRNKKEEGELIFIIESDNLENGNLTY